MKAILSRLRLSHFRTYKALDLVSEGRMVVLFGANGAGKTNILEAVSLLSPGRGLRRASNEEMMRLPEKIGWKISANLDVAAHIHEVSISTRPTQTRMVEIDGNNASQLALGSIIRILWVVPAMDRIWGDGAEQRRKFLDRITLSFEPKHAQAVINYEKAMRERNRLLKEQACATHWYEALEKQMGFFGNEINKNRQKATTHIEHAFAKGDMFKKFPQATLELVAPSCPYGGDFDNADALTDALHEGRARDLRAGRSLIGPHRTDLKAFYKTKNLPARDCSTGEQKALLISLMLANLRAILEDANVSAILLLDEVAAHLDPERRRVLYETLLELGVQTWMSGTDKSFFEDLEQKALFCHVQDKGGVSALDIENMK